MKRFLLAAAAACLSAFWVGAVSASTPGADVKLTHDANDPGYVSSYTIATGIPYTDPTLAECSRSRGRQNEPAVGVDPRNTSVVVGGSNDYCGVYNRTDSSGNPIAAGPIWLGYYRSQDAGASFVSSLVPGYPDDASPYAALAQVRTATSGDPVIAWDAEGRAFFGAEASGDPAGTAKTFGDVWIARYDNPGGPGGATTDDGKRYRGTVVVARGSSAPNLLGKFNDKTAIEADHNADGRCDNNVYFAYSRFTGNGGVGIYFARSTDHGASFTNPAKVSQTISDVQFPDIAVTGNDNVYLFFRSFESGHGPEGNAIYYVKSTDCGATFTRPQLLQTFIPYDAQDVSDPQPVPAQKAADDPLSDNEAPAQGRARDCGDFDSHCVSGYTFFRRDTQVRATADQFDKAHPDRLYVVYDPTKPGTQVPTGTTYGSIESSTGSQSAIYFIRVDGATGTKEVGPSPIDNEPVGHQTFPDISADNPASSTRGTLHAIWWDSRLDACYSPTRPIGNCADRRTVPSLDAWGARSTTYGATWSSQRVSDVTSNPNYEQFANRTVPFAGDYLYVSSLGDFSYGVWTDWRNTVQGTDPREISEDEDKTSGDVLQCRVFSGGSWSGDRCPRAGGIDQNIYGDKTP